MHEIFTLIFCFLLLHRQARSQCSTRLTINAPTELQTFRQYTVSVAHDTLPRSCGSSKSFKYTWKVTQMSSPKTDISEVLEYPTRTGLKGNYINMTKTPMLRSDPNVFYNLRYELKVTLKTAKKPESSETLYFDMVATDMQIMISGGAFREHEMAVEIGKLELDGSESKDLSFYEQILVQKIYTMSWSCTPPLPGGNKPPTGVLLWEVQNWNLKEEFETYKCTLSVTRNFKQFKTQTKTYTQTLKIMKPVIPVITAKCVQNCDRANAYKDTVLSWDCFEFCKDSQATWKADPPPADDSFFPANNGDSRAIKYLGKTFKQGETVTFSASVGYTTSNVTVTYRVIKLELSLNCTSNCELYDPRSEIVIAAECCGYDIDCENDCLCQSQNDCEKSQFVWTIWPVIDLEDYLDSTRLLLKIPGNTLEDKTDYNVTLESYENMGTLKFRTTEPIADLSIACSKNGISEECSSADSRDKLILTVSCSRFCEFNDFYWNIEPNSVQYNWEHHTIPGKAAITIPSNTFPNDAGSINFTVATGKARESFLVLFEELVPSMAITCTKNCLDTSNPLKMTTLEGFCKDRCTYATYNWSVVGARQPMQNDWLSENDTVLTIPAGAVDDNKEVTVTLSSSTQKFVWISMFSEPIAKLDIECVTNCGKPNPLMPTVMRVTCTEPSAESDICPLLEYKWDINPRPENFSWAAPRVLEEGNIVTFKEGVFTDNQKINLQVQGRKAKASKVLAYSEPVPDVELVCENENCGPSHPAMPVELKMVCKNNCYGVTYIWSFSPEPTDFKWVQAVILSDNNDTLTIKPNIFKDQDELEITVVAKKVTKSLKTKFAMVPPLIVVNCLTCQLGSHNPLKRVVLETNCSKYCMGKVEFEWSFDPVPKDFNWTKSIVLQKNNESLFVLPETFEDASNISVVVTDSIGKEGQGNVTISFVEPTPVLSIECIKNCWDGEPLLPTILSAKCVEECDNATKYMWTLEPEPPSMKLNISQHPRNESITIKAETYKDGDTVNVTLLLRKGNFTASLKYYEQTPELELMCIENCSRINPLKNVSFTVKCKDCLKEEYVWELDPLPEKFEWSNQIGLDPLNKTLTIIGYTFNDTNSTTVTVKNRKATKSIYLNFVELPAKLNISCEFNCADGVSDPLRPMKFNVNCTADCDRLAYVWYLLPPPPNINWAKDTAFGENNVSIYIREGIYPDEGSTRVKVASFVSEIYLDVEFKEETPQLKLRQNCSQENCLPCDDTGCYPNPYEPISFTVECQNFCQNLSYVWEVNPEPRDFQWGKNAISMDANQTLVVTKDTFQNEEKALVIARSRKGFAIANLTYIVPPPVLNLTCDPNSNCSEANVFKPTKFNLRCKYDCDKFIYDWKIDSTLNESWKNFLDVQQDKDGFSVTVKESTFNDEDIVTFTAVNDEVEGNITIRFVEFPPEIRMVCLANCNFSPRLAVKLTVECLEYCDELNYSWVLEPPSKHTPLENETNSEFVIASGSYADNATVMAKVRVRKSEATFQLNYSLPFWNGTCTIEPKNGISGSTKFTIECEDYQQPQTMFKIYQKSSQDSVTGVLLTYGYSALSTRFRVSTANNDSQGIQVMVGNGWETKAVVQLSIKASELVPPQGSELTLPDYIKTLIIGRNFGSFQDLLKRREYFSVVQMVSFLSTALSDLRDEEFAQHCMRHLYAGLLEVVNDIDPIQSMSLLRTIVPGPNLKDFVVVKLSSQLLMATTENMVKKQKQSKRYDEETLKDFLQKAVSLVSKILLPFALMAVTEPLNMTDDYPQYEELTQPRAEVLKNSKIITTSLLRGTAALAEVMHGINADKSLKSGKFQIVVSDRKLIGTENKINFTFPSGGSYITSPGHFPQVLQKVNAHEVNLKFRLLAYGIDPHWWNSPMKMKTEVLELSIKGAKIFPEPFSIFLKINNVTEDSKVVQAVASQHTFTRQYAIAEKSLFKAAFKFHGKPYFVFVGDLMPKDIKFTKVGFKITSDKNVTFYSTKRAIIISVYSEKGSAKFSYTYKAADCYYWEEGKLSWRKDECTISPEQPDPALIHCKCQHLSFFAGREYIPEEMVDVIEIPSEAAESSWLLGNVSLAVLFGFMLMIWCANWKDKELLVEDIVENLHDNIPKDKELYMVLIATGIARNAGTTANVGISIKGTHGSSRLHLLNATKSTTLERNKEHIFIMYSPAYLGDLLSIKLWHNSEGSKPNWYCERVMIQHVRTRKKYNFSVEQWFSLINGSGTTHGKFKVSDGNEKMSFCRRLRETIRADHHLLSLLVQRPRAGSYKETLVVGLVSCLTLMTTTMVFVSFMDGNTSFALILVGMLSALVVLPVNILMQFLFRNTP